MGVYVGRLDTIEGKDATSAVRIIVEYILELVECFGLAKYWDGLNPVELVRNALDILGIVMSYVLEECGHLGCRRCLVSSRTVGDLPSD